MRFRIDDHRRGLIAVATVTLLAVTGCARGGPAADPAGDPAAPGGSPVSAQAQQRYGAAPTPHPDVTYQPDVVIVGGGADSIRSVAADTFTWRIDPAAANADQLAPGKIMFLTGRAVGRVIDVRPEGDDLAVAIGPVDITDVIRDGTFTSAEPVPLAAARPVPDGAASWSQTSDDGGGTGGGSAVAGGDIGPVGGASTDGGLVVPAANQRPQLTPRPICCANGVGAEFTYSSAGVRLVGLVLLKMTAPTAAFHLEIRGAKVIRAEFEINGAAALRVEINATTSTGQNIDPRIPIPVDFSVPIGEVLGVPFAATVTQVIGVHTAFGAKDGNISAAGEWSLNQSMSFGYANGSFGVRAPTSISVDQSLMDSITGISVGVNGIWLDYHAKFHVGLGALGFIAGLYFELTLTLGMTIGSALGAPLVVCRSAQLGLWASYGVGYTIPAGLVTVINTFLQLFNAKPIPTKGGVGDTKLLYDKPVVYPNVPICRN
ncbi:hypothetical protein O7608_03320 [Solwaraspora sp. WMMA2056]|uniref:hypothetical protein n=1 Tax=Solwaraspora sp. WMMA2056 TaxID=3015161 RepID=UPI00259B72C4|nr:hypothetical protein [Solwaraspora sp. WMMA2056]WJK41478.1 hypothetical protein O7608_03320 [Solwaraspora sp. WMMA2056]